MSIALTRELIDVFNPLFSKESHEKRSPWRDRGVHVFLIPYSVITTLADTIIGTVSAVIALSTAGKIGVKKMEAHLESSKKIISLPYKHLLQACFPHAKVQVTDPVITDFAQRWIFDNATGPSLSSDNWFIRNICSRLAFSFVPIASLVTRVADAIIGIGAAPLSFLCLGRSQYFNKAAYGGLQIGGIVKDIFSSVIGIVNPWATTQA